MTKAKTPTATPAGASVPPREASAEAVLPLGSEDYVIALAQKLARHKGGDQALAFNAFSAAIREAAETTWEAL